MDDFCIGYVTNGVLDNITDLAEAWPKRQSEFGDREKADLWSAKTKLDLLLSCIDAPPVYPLNVSGDAFLEAFDRSKTAVVVPIRGEVA